jgi:protein-S-isoprenylcysteine O-methyltransferase Ste14
VRYGFSPVADRFPPRSLYGWVDMLLLVTVVGYSAWLTVGPRPGNASTGSVLAGVALWSAGMALRWWAIATLGSHFRIGQDEADKRAAFVAAGPYRFVRHPIYVALLLVAAGMALLTNLDLGAMTLLAVSVFYFVVQKRLEDRRWYRQADRALRH